METKTTVEEGRNKVAFLQLMDLANQAKERGDYDFANVVFHVLLEKYFHIPNYDFMSLEVETRDPEGRKIGETHDDLLVIVVDGERLNIPVPLVSNDVLIAVLKGAAIVPRREHNRKHTTRDTQQTDIEDFLATYKDMLPVPSAHKLSSFRYRHTKTWLKEDIIDYIRNDLWNMFYLNDGLNRESPLGIELTETEKGN